MMDIGYKLNVDAWMMFTFGHTPHTKNTNYWTCDYNLHHQYYAWSKPEVQKNSKWPHSLWTCHTKPSCYFRWNTNCIHPSIQTVKMNYLLIWIVWTYAQHNLVPWMLIQSKISHAYKYVMIGASSCISKVSSLFDSISTPWQPMVFMSIKGALSPQIEINKYVNACHLGIVSKFASPN